MSTYADIAPQPKAWLWGGRLLRGGVTIVAGPGGSAKGLMAADLAARVTTGRPMPGETEAREPASVIMITPEDDLEEDVAWRLDAAGADRGRCHDLTFLPGGIPFELSVIRGDTGHIGQLRELIDEIGDVALVVIDPLLACVNGPVASNAAARRVMAPLQRLAKETGVAILLTHHTVKSGAIAGSKGLTDAARIVYRISRQADNPAVRVMSVEKVNNAPELDDIQYTLTGEGTSIRVAWAPEAEQQQRPSWRDRLRGRPLAAAPSPQPAAPRFAATFSSGRGSTLLGDSITDLGEAMRVCEGTRQAAALARAGRPLQWRQVDARTWTAGEMGYAFAVATTA